MDLGLQGAKVLVTAASQGLGAATARRFSLEGALVCISSRNLEKLQATASEINAESGHAVFTHAADVSDPTAVERMVRNAAEMMGGLDVLVTNAGGPPAGGIDDFDNEAWVSATQLVFLSTVQMIRAALPYLRQSSRPAILTITSVAARQPVSNLTLSNAIRPAVLGLVKTLAQELGPDGIRINSLLPGTTDTERISSMIMTRSRINQTTTEEERAKTVAEIPLRRMGTPEEFANAAAFLSSPAGGFINGVCLAVDGGTIRTV